MSSMVGSLAVARVMHKYPGASEAIARSLAERLRELLPSEKYRVEAKGPCST
jgi:hypothetical protein